MNPSFLQELTAAARGLVALLIGDTRAGTYFDFSLRGLIGSFIAVLLISTLDAVLPVLMGAGQPGGIAETMLLVVLLYGVQLAFPVIVLRQIKRMDGLVPYIVTDNWMTFYLLVIAEIVAVIGLGGDAVVPLLGIVGIVLAVNIARIIVALTPLQIGMLLISRIVGGLIGLAIIGLVLPPDVAAQVAG